MLQTASPPPLRAAIYARLSEAKERDGKLSDSVQGQIEALTEMAKRQGYELVATHHDDDISGYKGAHRPGYADLLADMAAGRLDVVLARHVDRFGRNDSEASSFRVACVRFGVKFHTLHGGLVDVASAEGGFMATVLGGVAQFESDLKSQRLAQHFGRKAARGELQAPKGTFGYSDDDRSKLVPWEAELIREAYMAVSAGRSTGSIVREWNAKKIPQRKTSKTWTYAHINSILRRPRNAGMVSHNGKILEGVTGRWEPIVGIVLWTAVQSILNAPGRKTRPGFQPTRLTPGLAVCGLCGARMRSNTATDKRRGTRYSIMRCSAPKLTPKDRHPSIRLDPVESAARKEILRAFMYGGDALFPQDDSSAAGAILARLDAIREYRAEMLVNRREGLITAAEFRAEVAAHDEEVTRLQAALEAEHARSSSLTMLADLKAQVLSPERGADGRRRVSFDDAADLLRELERRFDTLHIEQQRRLARELLAITIYAGRGDTFEIEHTVVTALNAPNADPYEGQ